MAPLLLLLTTLRHLQAAPACTPRGGPQPDCPMLHVSEPAGGKNHSGPRAPPPPALLLDPSPGASFGHPLQLFHLDFGSRQCLSLIPHPEPAPCTPSCTPTLCSSPEPPPTPQPPSPGSAQRPLPHYKPLGPSPEPTPPPEPQPPAPAQ
ncbi:unnamed protein product [Eretmochelys imbricata]